MTALQTLTAEQANKETPIGENFESLSAAGIFAKRHTVTAGLVWGFYGGLYNGNTIADGTVTLTNAATNYVVVLRSSGVVSTSTSSANSVNPLYAKLYQLTTAGSVVTVEVDQRWDANGLFFSGVSTTAANIPAQRYTVELLNTTDSDPGPGLIKFNNATPASATALYIDDSTSDGVDLSTYFAGLGATGYITIQSTADAGEWAIFRWTAITDQTGYFRFTVTSYASLGTLDDADAVVIAFDSDASGGGGGSTQGKHGMWVPAGAIQPSVTGGCASLARVAMAANQPDLHTIDFDATTQEYAQFFQRMPKSWNEGTVTFVAEWSHPATTVNFGVVWDLQAVALSDDDTIAAAYGTAVTSTDTGGTTNDVYASPESAAITIAGTPAAEDMVCLRLSRVTGNGSDTMAVDARLHGITLYFTTDADTDA